MTLVRPRRSREVRVAINSNIAHRDDAVGRVALRDARVMLAEERKARRRVASKNHRPGSHRERAKRELAKRPTLPLTERQQALYDLLTDEPQRPVDLRAQLGLNQSQLGAVMSSLCARGLALRLPGGNGWRREPSDASG